MSCKPDGGGSLEAPGTPLSTSATHRCCSIPKYLCHGSHLASWVVPHPSQTVQNQGSEWVICSGAGREKTHCLSVLACLLGLMSPALPGFPVSQHRDCGIMPWEGAWVHSKEPLQGWCFMEWDHVSQYNEQPGGTLQSFPLIPV